MALARTLADAAPSLSIPQPGLDPHAECAHEPIHVPGAIQPAGALLAIDPDTLMIVQASANLDAVYGLPASEVLGQTAADIFGDDGWRRLEEMLDASLTAAPGKSRRLPTRGRSPWPFVVPSASRSPCGRICIELEPRGEERDRTVSDRHLVPTVQSVLAILRGARSTTELAQAIAREMRRITGHDRFMVYRFAPDGHGEVIAEERAEHLESYLGLHYPASDIPEQARRMYLAQRVRVIPDVAYPPVPMLCLPGAGDRLLDMTHCALRSVSPAHVEYLSNMGVRATLVVSLLDGEGALWGMLVGQAEQPHPVTPELRGMVDLIGQVVSVLLASLAEAERSAAQLARERNVRAVATALADMTRPTAEALAATDADLLAGTAASGFVARLGGRLLRVGDVPGDEVVNAILKALPAAAGSGLFATDRLEEHLPEGLVGPLPAGALLLPLPHGQGDALLWLRPEVASTVRWAGNPNQTLQRSASTGALSPRRSFAVWQEEVRGRSAPWSDADLAAARELRRVLGDAHLRRAEAELARLRHHDPLTGLANRRLLQERLDELRRRASLGKAAPAALVYVDLDRFKDVNDSLGHEAGDALLIQIAERLRATIGGAGLIARLGGDEFAVLREGLDAEEADALADRVRHALDDPFRLADRPYQATCSVGLAHTGSAGIQVGDLLQAADAAMYVAKRRGGNGSAAFAESLRAEAAHRLSTEQDLRAALKEGGRGLLLHFQPIVELTTGRLAGLEALARWRHPQRGMIPPSDFIPVAEEAGLIAELGDWVLESALDFVAAAQPRGAMSAAFVTVNVSPRQLASAGFAARVIAGLAARGLPPGALCIEVTEAAVADEYTARDLATLRAAGLRVAIDDFGTGYSSLSYLNRLPATTVKLDRSFLPAPDLSATDPAAETPDPRGSAETQEGFTTAVVALARRAGLDVVMEGVETIEHLLIAARAGASKVQGFLLARPMPADAALDLVRGHAAGAPPPWAGAAQAAIAVACQSAVLGADDFAFRQVVNAMGDAVIVTGPDLADGGPLIQYMNPAAEHLTGYALPALLGRSPRVLQGENTSALVRRQIGAALAEQSAVDCCLLNYRQDGTPYMVEMRIMPMRDGAGALSHFVSIERTATGTEQFCRTLPQD